MSACFSIKNDRKMNKAIRKLKQAEALYPDMFKKDTLVIHDTVIVESIHADTVTKVVFNDSIVVINNDRMVVKYYYDTITNNIIHEGECKDIIVPTETLVPVKSIIYPTWYDQAKPWFPWIWVVLAIFVISKLWKKISFL